MNPVIIKIRKKIEQKKSDNVIIVDDPVVLIKSVKKNPQYTGSGVVISDKGEILSAGHVVTGGKSGFNPISDFYAVNTKGEEIPLELVKYIYDKKKEDSFDAQYSDLALFRFKEKNVKASYIPLSVVSVPEGSEVIGQGFPGGAKEKTILKRKLIESDTTDQPFLSGMSGGGVFFDNKIIGIVRSRQQRSNNTTIGKFEGLQDINNFLKKEVRKYKFGDR